MTPRKIFFKIIIPFLALIGISGCEFSILEDSGGITAAKQKIEPFEISVKSLRKEERKIQNATYYYFFDSGFSKLPTSSENCTAFYLSLKKTGEKKGRVSFGKCVLLYEGTNHYTENIKTAFYFPYQTNEDLVIFKRDDNITFENSETGSIDGILAFENLKQYNGVVGLVIPVNLMGDGKKVKKSYEFRIRVRVIQSF